MKVQNVSELPSFIINLADRHDRKKHCDSQIIQNKLNASYVGAVSAESITLNDPTFLSPPQKACWESHMIALEMLFKSVESYGLILEDDFVFLDLNRLNRLLSTIDFSDWDIIQIGFLATGFLERISISLKNIEALFFLGISILVSRNNKLQTLFGSRLRVSRSKNLNFNFIADDLRAGAHAYIISKDTAARILHSVKDQQVLTIDGFFISTNWTRPFRSIRIKRSLVAQIDSRSSITSRS
jgi:GR25 family glycosyltransferase involved in LPS biosynthesis